METGNCNCLSIRVTQTCLTLFLFSYFSFSSFYIKEYEFIYPLVYRWFIQSLSCWFGSRLWNFKKVCFKTGSVRIEGRVAELIHSILCSCISSSASLLSNINWNWRLNTSMRNTIMAATMILTICGMEPYA